MPQLRFVRHALCLIAVLAATDWVVAQQSAPFRGRPARGERQLLYVPTPGSAEAGVHTGYGVLVFDVRNNWKFVKRIPTFGGDIKAWQDQDTDEVKGFEIIPENGLLYLGTFTGLSAFSLITERLVWEQKYDGNCCDRMTASPDGKVLYVPELGPIRTKGQDGWLVVDANTGKTIKKIDTELSRGAHNTIYSPDGSKVFMAGLNGAFVSVADTKTHTVMQTVGPFSAPPANLNYPNARPSLRPFTINGSGTLVFVNVNGLLGFEVGDVRTGKMLYRVEVPGYTGWTRDRINGEGNPTHGIAMSPDEKELWVTDNINSMLHIFDSTVMPPKFTRALRLPSRRQPGEPRILDYPYWVTFGLDGKYVYPSTGHVIDAATKQIVGELFDEHGKSVRSEKIIEVLFRDGKPVRASDQFGYGMVTKPATN